MLRKIIEIIRGFVRLTRPPKAWIAPIIVLSGVLIGATLAIVHVSRATSYMSDDPRACINCHIMDPQYATWQHGSHGRFTTCNDCHVPHDSVFRKYFFKAKDGSRHSSMFMLRLEPQVIRIHEEGANVVMENCLRCHGNLVGGTQDYAGGVHKDTTRKCWECHRETPHGRVNSLASTPNARIPGLAPAVPAWLSDAIAGAEKPPASPAPATPAGASH